MAHGRRDWVREVYYPLRFVDMTDTPGSMATAQNKGLKVDSLGTQLLWTDANPDNHHARHEDGADAINLLNISAFANHHARHEYGGADEISVANLLRPYMRVYRSGDYSLADDTPSVLQLNAKSYDPDNIFNTSTYRATIPSGQDGRYLLIAYFRFDNPPSNTKAAIWPLVNGTGRSGTITIASGGTYLYRSTTTDVLDLNAGDYIEIYVHQISGAARTIRGTASETYFALHRLS